MPARKTHFTDANHTGFVTPTFDSLAQRRAAQMILTKHWLRSIWRRNRKSTSLLILFTLASFIAALAVPIAVQRIIDGAKSATLSATIVSSILILAFVLIELAATYARDSQLIQIGARIDRSVSYFVFRNWLKVDMSYFANRSANEELNLFYEIQAVRNFVLRTVPTICFDILGAVISILLLFWYSPIIAMFCIIFVTLFTFLLRTTQSIFLARAGKQIAVEGRRASFVQEVLSKMQTVRRETAESYFLSKWRHLTAKSIAAVIETSISNRKYSLVALTFTRGMYTISVLIAAALYSSGNITVGAIAAVLLLVSRVVAPMQQSVGVIEQMQQLRYAVSMINRMPSVADKRTHALKVGDDPFTVALNDIHLSYEEMRGEVIKGITLSLPSRGLIAIVGPNGSGKSTFLRAVIGELRASTGEVLIAGVPLDQIQQRDLYKNIAYVGQEQIMFDDSIRNNIIFGRSSGEDDLDEALKSASLGDRFSDVEALSDELSSTTAGLSGGEQQKVTLARLFARQFKIAILDEPSAHLDKEATVHLGLQLRRLALDRLIIVATHDPKVMRQSDRIIALKDGLISFEGSYETFASKEPAMTSTAGSSPTRSPQD